MAGTAMLLRLTCSLALLLQDPAGAVGEAAAQARRAKALLRAGQLDEAQRLAGSALAVFERNLPEQDLAAADALLCLGAIAGQRSDLPTAVLHYRRALGLRERHDPPGAPYLQLLRFNLATSLQGLADDAGALAVASAALRDVPGGSARTPGAGNLHAVVAMANDGLGRYQDALLHYREALAGLTPSYGSGHPDVLRLQGLMAVILCRLGRAEEGLPQLEATAAAMQKAPGVPPVVRVELETALAVMQLIHRGGEAALAAVRVQLATAIADSRAGVVGAAGRLILLMSCLAYGQADPGDTTLASDALLQCEAEYGDNHPHTAAALANLSRLHNGQGDIEGAATRLDRAMAILEANPSYLGADRWKILWNRASLHWRQDQRAAAHRLFLRILAEVPRLLDAWTTPLDETERRELTATARMAVDAAITMARDLGLPAAEVWQPVLAWRTLVSRGFLQSLQWLQSHRDPRTQAVADELHAAQAAVQWCRRPGGDAAGLEAALAKREELARRLAQRLEAGGSAAPTVDAIAEALAPDEVWIDFFAQVAATPANDRQYAIEERLLGFVVRRGQQPTLVDLGPLADVASAVETFLRASSRWTAPSPTAEQTIGAAGARLADLVWKPLRSQVPPHSRVLVSPDTVLALVPWACLPGSTAGSFLVEEHEFVQVADPGDLVARSAWPKLQPVHELLTIGAVDYGPGAFRALPQTGEEAAAVAAAFAAAGGRAVRALAGGEATPERFAAATTGATFVHIATHGWFRGARTLPDVVQRWKGLELGGKALPRASISPGTDCGIALAGASGPGGREQGCLTAEDLALLDLTHCELAVLSACETGLGTVSAGDGLLGLRRALRLAGARRSLTSVWRVDDAAAQRCMVAFYEALWVRREPPSAALRSAQLAMLAAARKAGGQALTGQWGGFVLESR